MKVLLKAENRGLWPLSYPFNYIFVGCVRIRYGHLRAGNKVKEKSLKRSLRYLRRCFDTVPILRRSVNGISR